jgi:hypothetical protein
MLDALALTEAKKTWSMIIITITITISTPCGLSTWSSWISTPCGLRQMFFRYLLRAEELSE